MPLCVLLALKSWTIYQVRMGWRLWCLFLLMDIIYMDYYWLHVRETFIFDIWTAHFRTQVLYFHFTLFLYVLSCWLIVLLIVADQSNWMMNRERTPRPFSFPEGCFSMKALIWTQQNVYVGLNSSTVSHCSSTGYSPFILGCCWHETIWDCWINCLKLINTELCVLDVVNTILYLSESEEENSPKKPSTPINGKVAAEKPAAKYVNNICQTRNVRTWSKLNLAFK